MKDCYIDPYLLSCIVPFRAPLGTSASWLEREHCLPLGTRWPWLSCLMWLRGCLGIYNFLMPMHSWLSTHVTRFWLSTYMSCLHLCIAVFLFTQLEHDSSVKGQYATRGFVQNSMQHLSVIPSHLSSKCFSCTRVTTWLQLGMITILFYQKDQIFIESLTCQVCNRKKTKTISNVQQLKKLWGCFTLCQAWHRICWLYSLQRGKTLPTRVS